MPQERGEGPGERRDAPEQQADAQGEPEYDPAVWAALGRLSQLASAVSRGRLTERAADAAGLSLDRPAVSVLLTLHTAHKPLRIGEIATRMQVVGPHVTRQVQILERRGLVRRVADPDDRRASLAEPTEQGAAAAERYMASMIGWFMRAMSDWPDQDRQELGRLLGRFADDVMESLAHLDDDSAAHGS
jgi:DNA-binding MarR family transcriptional regulator